MARHRHRWEEVRRYAVPPVLELLSVKNATEEFARELAFGLTVVELRCAECGDVSERRLTGGNSHAR